MDPLFGWWIEDHAAGPGEWTFASWHGRVIVSGDTEKLNALMPKWRVRMIDEDVRATREITSVEEWAATAGLVWNAEREDWRQGPSGRPETSA